MRDGKLTKFCPPQYRAPFGGSPQQRAIPGKLLIHCIHYFHLFIHFGITITRLVLPIGFCIKEKKRVANNDNWQRNENNNNNSSINSNSNDGDGDADKIHYKVD